MHDLDIFNGNALAPGEAIVWRGAPSWSRLVQTVYHVRGVSAYFAFLLVFNAYQAWAKQMTLEQALTGSVPLIVMVAMALGLLAALAYLSARSTRYTITDRRVILHYGIAMPATLSLPFSRIIKASVAMNHDHSGDIPLVLRADDHMPYLKLWPLARPWAFSHPEPMLRCVPHAAVVGGLLTRALAMAAQAGSTKVARYVPGESDRELLSA